MDWYWWVVLGGGTVALLAVLQRAGLVDFRGTGRRGGGGSGLMSLGDEVFAPSRHEAAQERAREAVLPAPAPIPGDGDKGIFSTGPVVIDVSHVLDDEARGRSHP